MAVIAPDDKSSGLQVSEKSFGLEAWKLECASIMARDMLSIFLILLLHISPSDHEVEAWSNVIYTS